VEIRIIKGEYRMNKFKAIVASLVIVAGIVGISSVVSAQSSNTCTVKEAALGQWGNAISVNGENVSASFVVEGTNCTTPVTLAVWERPTAEGINDQKLNNYTTETFGPGTHSLSATLPDCMWQVDVVEGANPTAADGTANYQYQNGEFVDGGLRDFLKGGAGVCEEKPVTPVKPVKPTVVVKTKKVIVKEQVPVVTTVPSTGGSPAAVVASTLGISTSAGLAFDLIRRKLGM
jgi:hypothetical protein